MIVSALLLVAKIYGLGFFVAFVFSAVFQTRYMREKFLTVETIATTVIMALESWYTVYLFVISIRQIKRKK